MALGVEGVAVSGEPRRPRLGRSVSSSLVLGPVTHSMAAPLAVLEPQLGLTQPSGGALRVPVVVASRCQEPGLGVHLVLLVVRVEPRRLPHRHVLRKMVQV